MKTLIIGLGLIGEKLAINMVKDKAEIVGIDKEYKNIDGITFYQIDLLNINELEEVFCKEDIYQIIYLANSRKGTPILAYDNYIQLWNVLKMMQKYEVSRLIYNSDALVYDTPYKLPITEDFYITGNDSYTRVLVNNENLIKDCYRNNKNFSFTILRFSNVLCKNYHDNAFISDLLDVMNGEKEYLVLDKVKTYDETIIEDYIHLEDCIIANQLALAKLDGQIGLKIYNLGMSIGISRLDILETFSVESNKEIPYILRENDEIIKKIFYLDCNLASEELGFETKFTLEDMIKDVLS